MQEDCVYDNEHPNTDKSTQMKPLNKTEVPKSQRYSIYENVHFNIEISDPSIKGVMNCI